MEHTEHAQFPPFFDLSVLIEQLLNEIQSQKRLLLAMHAAVEQLEPKYKEEFKKALDAQPKENDSPDAMALAKAKSTLLKLRSLR